MTAATTAVALTRSWPVSQAARIMAASGHHHLHHRQACAHVGGHSTRWHLQHLGLPGQIPSRVGSVANAASLERVTPTVVYYSGASATGTALPAAPSLAGTYTVLTTFRRQPRLCVPHASIIFIISKAMPTVTVSDPGRDCRRYDHLPCHGHGGGSRAPVSHAAAWKESRRRCNIMLARAPADRRRAPRRSRRARTPWWPLSREARITMPPPPPAPPLWSFPTRSSRPCPAAVRPARSTLPFAQALTVNVVDAQGQPGQRRIGHVHRAGQRRQRHLRGRPDLDGRLDRCRGHGHGPGVHRQRRDRQLQRRRLDARGRVPAVFALANQHVVTEADPINPSQTALLVGGAPGNDQIRSPRAAAI